jgi:hypothetical protein
MSRAASMRIAVGAGKRVLASDLSRIRRQIHAVSYFQGEDI